MTRYTPSTTIPRRGSPIATMVEHPDGAHVSHASITPLLRAAMRLSAVLGDAGAVLELNEELEKLL